MIESIIWKARDQPFVAANDDDTLTIPLPAQELDKLIDPVSYNDDGQAAEDEPVKPQAQLQQSTS